MQSLSKGFSPIAYILPSKGLTPIAYIQPLGTKPSSVRYKQLSSVTPKEYMQPSGPTFAAYIQPLGTGSLPAAYALLGKLFTSVAYIIFAILNTGTNHSRDLSNLAKIYTDDVKYSGRNDNFTFKLSIFHDIQSKSDILSKTKIKAFSIMLKSLALNYYYSNISISDIVINFK